MGFAEVKEKSDSIQKAVEESSVLVGKTGVGRVSGLTIQVGPDGMEAYSKHLKTLSESLKQSMFKVLFMGAFKNGKSTTINALLGQELALVGTTEKTAVIAQVVYGTDDGLVRIFKNGSSVPEVASFKEFTTKYQLTREDKKLVEDKKSSGIDDRFSSVDYVLLNNPSKLLKNGVQLIDSPGLAASHSRTKVTHDFYPHANAVIFLMNALQLFTADEKDFIARHFVKVEPKPRHVFFLINRINQVDEDEGIQAVTLDTETILKNVFSTNKIFNRELYSKRVFFVDSKRAYKDKKEGKQTDEFGVREFKRFEKELEAFLTSEDRVIARYQPVAANLAAVFFETKSQVEERHIVLSKTPVELERNRQESTKKLDKLQEDVDRMEETIKNTQEIVKTKIWANLQTFLTTDMVKIWKEHSETFDQKLGILDMFKLVSPFHSQKEKARNFQTDDFFYSRVYRTTAYRLVG